MGHTFMTPGGIVMIAKSIEELTLAGFNDFGKFARFVDPTTPHIGKKPVEFFRDMLLLDIGSATKASFSVCRVEKRPEVIDVLEYHDYSAEMCMSLDADILLYVAPAGVPDTLNTQDIRVFRVPSLTMVVMNRGVWHHGVFTDKADHANVLIGLPERLYVTDCIVRQLSENEKVTIKR
jgi:ureidoglycolate lyase